MAHRLAIVEGSKEQRRAVEHYEKVLVDHVGSLEITTISMNIKENTRPCRDQFSRLHILACGHAIYTDKPSMCGRNCTDPIENFAPFVCTLCERQKMIKSGRIPYRSSRSTELILPDFPAFDQSHIPMMMRARECNIAAIQSSFRKAVIPQTARDIAILRLNDKKRLDRLLEKLEWIAEKLGSTARMIGQIRENFMFCVDHQHLWINASYGQLAAAVLHLALATKTQKPALLNEMATHFSPSTDGIEDLLAPVEDALIDFNGRKAIASFMPHFAAIRHQFCGKEEILTHLALRVWRKILKSDIFCSEFIAKFWRRIAVSCIYAVVCRNEIIHFDEALIEERHIKKICAVMCTGWFGKEGDALDHRVAWQIQGDESYHLLQIEIDKRRQRKLRVRRTRVRDQGFGWDVNTLVASVVGHMPVASHHRTDEFANVEFDSFEAVLYDEKSESQEDVKRVRKS